MLLYYRWMKNGRDVTNKAIIIIIIKKCFSIKNMCIFVKKKEKERKKSYLKLKWACFKHEKTGKKFFEGKVSGLNIHLSHKWNANK